MGASSTLQFLNGIQPTLDTSAYAAADVLFNAVEIPNMVAQKGRSAKLLCITAHDKAAQAAAMDLLFFQNTATLGTLNAAVDITDAAFETAGFLGHVSIVAGDWTAIVTGHALTKLVNPGLVLEAISTSRSIWMAAIGRTTTPTFAATSLKFGFGYELH